MTSRERIFAALSYTNTDKIPVVYHPSPAGLYAHGEKLLRLFNEYPPDNSVSFTSVPEPDPRFIDANGVYREERVDEWGTTYVNTIYGIAGSPHGFPLTSWVDQANYTLPPVPMPEGPEFRRMQADIKAGTAANVSMTGWVSLYEKLCTLRPTEDVLCDLCTSDEDLLHLLDRIVEYQKQVIANYLALDYDAIYFADDWGSQAGQLISTDLFRGIFKKRYEQLMEPVRKAGKKIFFHSCGKLDGILPELLSLNIDVLWPQIALYDLPILASTCKAAQTALYIHPDRQKLIPFGTPGEITAKVKEYSVLFKKLGGGGIFYVEIENDAPWDNVVSLIRSIHASR